MPTPCIETDIYTSIGLPPVLVSHPGEMDGLSGIEANP